MKQNKVFSIELCPEDARRILSGLQLLKDQLQQQVDQSDNDLLKHVAWLEWTYASELLYMLADKFDLEMW